MFAALSRAVGRLRGKQLSPPDRGGAWTTIFDSYPGAWQADGDDVRRETLLAFHAVYSCVTLIANDIGKLPFQLMSNDGGIWSVVENSSYSPVLRRPNAYQNQIQFRESWMISRLTRGNTYVLKERDNRGVVVRLHVLDPDLVEPLVSPDGAVFYRLRRDNMPGIEDDVTVPAREIIHDRMNCLYHPLVGVSPLYASALATGQGLSIQRNQKRFFTNNATPSGILSAPGNIDAAQAKTIRDQWQTNYSGENYGRIAVVGNDLKFSPLAMTATDAQLVEQLKLTAEIVCSVFHVPMHMIDLGPPPARSNEDTYLGYYSRALQSPIEAMELCLAEGLGMDSRKWSIGLKTEALMRMDTATRYKAWSEAVGGGWMSPDEARAKEDLQPVEGGDTPYMQQQNYSLAALAARDKTNPLAAPPAAPVPPSPPADDPAEDQTRAILDRLSRRAPETLHAGY